MTAPTGPADMADRDEDLVQTAITRIRNGQLVIVTDDTDREDEADLICAAETATPHLLAQMIRHTSGIICVPMSGDNLDRLGLPAMVDHNTDQKQTAFTVSVDAADQISTGVSATDRAHTIRQLASPDTRPDQLTRPGHVFPLRGRAGGVLERRGHTEAGLDLARLAGLHPAAVLAELTREDGTMMRGPHLWSFARRHQLPVISVTQLANFRCRHDPPVDRVATANLPTPYGDFTAVVHRSQTTGLEHLTLLTQNPAPGQTAAPDIVRVHSECLTGDSLSSLRCDCGRQLHDALATISDTGHGALIYLRGHEGRGIGLGDKIRAYTLQEHGHDTVEANLDLGLPVDARSYTDAAHILTDLGIGPIQLITNNPAKRHSLEQDGITVTCQLSTPTFATPHNQEYLQTKHDRLGHQFAPLDQDHHAGSTSGPATRCDTRRHP